MSDDMLKEPLFGGKQLVAIDRLDNVLASHEDVLIGDVPYDLCISSTKHITRKRFTKIIMGHRVDRNTANSIASKFFKQYGCYDAIALVFIISFYFPLLKGGKKCMKRNLNSGSSLNNQVLLRKNLRN